MLLLGKNSALGGGPSGRGGEKSAFWKARLEGGGLGLRPERPGGFSGSLVFCFGGVVRGVRSQ